MDSITDNLIAALPGVDADIIRRAIAEAISNSDLPQLREELSDLKEEAVLLRQEIGNLNSRLIRHRDGVENASLAGLDVLGERARQRRVEGYTDEHDDSLDTFSLSAAALAYITDARLRGTTGHGFDNGAPVDWPYGDESWRPKHDIRKSFEQAAALLLAEMDTLDRKALKVRMKQEELV